MLEARAVCGTAMMVVVARDHETPDGASWGTGSRPYRRPWRFFRSRHAAAWSVMLAFYGACVPSVRAQDLERWQPLVSEASARFGIPPEWIQQVMRAESAGQVMIDGRPTRSAKGAIGLMQLMPGTWQEMRARLGLGSDPDEPRDNVLAGTGYLRLLYDRFGYPGLFAAYNAGPGRYERYLAGIQLPAETRAYLGRVVGRLDRAQGTGVPPDTPRGVINGVMKGPMKGSDAAAILPGIHAVSGPLQDARFGVALFVAPSGTSHPPGSSEDTSSRAVLDPLFAIRRQRGSDGAP